MILFGEKVIYLLKWTSSPGKNGFTLSERTSQLAITSNGKEQQKTLHIPEEFVKYGKAGSLEHSREQKDHATRVLPRNGM